MSVSWKEAFRSKASIYSLDNDTKQWIMRGTSGTLCMYINATNPNDRTIQWTKSSQQIYWKLINSKLKRKGDRAWILKAIFIGNNKNDKDEIIAIRFSNQNISNQFSTIFTNITADINFINSIQSEHNNKWQCKQCLYNNTIDTTQCIMCNASRSQSSQQIPHQIQIQPPTMPCPITMNLSEWKCPFCTHSNGNAAIKCGLCGTPINSNTYNPPLNDSITNNEDVSKWICAVCTYQNDIVATACIMCGLSANESSKAQNQPQNTFATQTWKCTVCTLPNFSSSMKCEACNSLRFASKIKQNSLSMIQPQYMSTKNDTTISMVEFKANCDKNGNVMTTEYQFKKQASRIALNCYDPLPIIETIKSVINKLVTKNDIRYRTLDTTNPKVMDRLIGYEGVLEFLLLLGYKEDTTGTKLFCEKKPCLIVVRNAWNALSLYQLRFCNGRVMIVCHQKENEKYKESAINKLLLEFDEIVVFGYIRKNNTSVTDIPNELIKLITLYYYEKLWSIKKIKQDTNGNDEDYEQLLLEEVIEYTVKHTMKIIIIAHKMFTDSITLIKNLRKIFVETTKKRNQIKIRINILELLRNWMQLYWRQDFMENDELKKELNVWLKEELLNNEYRKIENIINKSLITDLISSISTNFNRLQSLNITNTKKDDYVYSKMLDDKQRIKDKLLVFGWIRNENKSIPSEIVNIFLRFYYDGVVIPKHFQLSNICRDDIADQITLIDTYIFNKIDEREFLNQNWKKRNNDKLSPNILKMIKQFNNLTIFLQIEILKEKSVGNRSKTIKRIIQIGQRFRELNNYNSLCVVYCVLNSAPIHRLKVAWKRVPEKCINIYNQFKNVFDRKLNQRNLRRLMEGSKPPCIPHIGLCLQDLVFIDDGGSITDYTNLRQNSFNKIVKMVEIIRNIKSYQIYEINGDSYDKKIKENLILQKFIMMELEKVKDITEDQIWDISTEIKKMDQKSI